MVSRTPHPGYYIALFLTVIVLGAFLRLPNLCTRPMHTDEAVHGIKFGALLEENHYRYDPREYHGPALNYLTLIPARLSSAEKMTEVNERTLRIVPACCGILLVGLFLLLKDELGAPVTLFAGIFTAISPAMVYYSRYYIQEMLLVFFSFAALVCGYRYLHSRHVGWACALGISLGLMHATKETCIIAIAAMLISLIPWTLLYARYHNLSFKTLYTVPSWHLLTALGTAFLVSALLYSSFVGNLRGVLDSLIAYTSYFQKAGHNEWHLHPWYYYFQLLTGTRQAGTRFWSEGIILICALAGLIVTCVRAGRASGVANFTLYLSFYTVLMTVIYCAIPYKTPWSMLGFYHALIVMAAVGGASFLRIASNRVIRLMSIVALLTACCHLLLQSYQLNYRYDADPTNPYVYAHTSPDIFVLTGSVDRVVRQHPDGVNMFIEVICPGHDYWPLPWYFRFYPNVGWWSEVDFSQQAAPLIIASPRVEGEVLRKLFELPEPGEKRLYVPLLPSYTELRPGLEIRGYVRRDLYREDSLLFRALQEFVQ